MNFQKLLERKTRLEKELEAVNSKIEEQKYTKKDSELLFSKLKELQGKNSLPIFTTLGYTNKSYNDLLELWLSEKTNATFCVLDLDKDFDKFISILKLELRALNLESDAKEISCYINISNNELLVVKGISL